MNGAELALRQVRLEQRGFWRNRSAVAATFLFPVAFLVVCSLVFKGDDVPSRGGIPYLTFFVPGVIAFGVIATTYLNLATSLTALREQGVLRRLQGTPLPLASYMAGRLGSALLTAVAMVALTVAVGAANGVTLEGHAVPGFLFTLLVGTATFCVLGIATTAVVPNADAAPAVVNGLIFPLMFVSSVYFPLDDAPGWLATLAGVFPIKHFANGLQFAFHPDTAGLGFRANDVLVLVAWGVAGALFALRRFRWEPQSS